MAQQDFTKISGGEPSLLRQVEEIVVESHRRMYEAQSHPEPWSKPVAYRWLRFEDPEPVARLQEGLKELRRKAARIDPGAVEKLSQEAEKGGFSY
jgi:organic radical activating enzyme